MSTVTLPYGSYASAIDNDDPGAPWLSTTITLAVSSKSDYLWLSDFGFDIPLTATILGVEVEVTRYQNDAMGGDIEDDKIRLVLPGPGMDPEIPSPDNKALAGSWPTSSTAQVYGGATDLWGFTAITPLEVSSTPFGLYLKVKENGSGMSSDAIVDQVSITVHYNPDGLLGDLIASMLTSISSSTTAAQQAPGSVSVRSQSKTVRVTPYRH